ncbi:MULTISPECIES: BREX protein BrxB domain-containing protein [Halobacteriales]|uniref:BREX protein BrxB domain-containing protein n=1 Tax=Halorubrum glutamatedens TaxID=2707018 RepID=A0ABD5QU59_9EURY|nr:BREX protein BrxB domain-containing protein [Halobellus captivus]
MSQTSSSPYHEFKEKLRTFAQGQHGIRNPFVIAAVDPAVEHRVADRLATWSDGRKEAPEIPDNVTVQPIWLDELLPRTDVYKLLVDLGEPLAELEGDTSPGERIEETMQDRLAEELVQQMIEHELSETQLETQSHVVLLLNLGSLYPFTRASELLDELDRRNVKSTIGIPFPGDVVGGKLSFFGGESRHYYPAHQIDGQIQGVHLQ